MVIGALSVKLRMPENSSLKDKRQIVKSITAQVKNKFNVSIAEVGDNDNWELATIGIATVSNDSRFTNEVLSKVVNHIENILNGAELLDYEIELLHALT